MGGSEKPVMRYSTSELAKDLIELLDHLGWTAERQLHVSGVSMGGMIAQELVSFPSHIFTSLFPTFRSQYLPLHAEVQTNHLTRDRLS